MEKLKLENKRTDDYRARCYVCHSDNNLSMHALRHRESIGIIGWMFVCPKCIDKIAEVHLVTNKD